MKFPKLKIKNFLAITDLELSLADRGLCQIQGVNNDDSSADSNGAGKSSIADALCWCFYGTTARGESGDDVVNYNAGSGTEVTTEVIDGADHYEITRYRKHKTGKNSLQVFKLDVNVTGGFNKTDLTKGTDKLTQEIVDRILGASLDVFASSIYAGQERMPNLPAMTDKNLKVLLEEASGATLLESAYEEARKRTKAASMAYADLSSKINSSMNSRDLLLNNALKNALSQQEQWSAAHKTRVSAIEADLAAAVLEINTLKKSISSEEITALEKELSEFKARMAAVSDENDELDRLKQLHSSAKAAQVVADSEKTRAENALKKAEVELAAVQHKVGCPCDSCGRPLTEKELDAATKLATQRVQDAQSAVDAANSKLALAINLVASTANNVKTFALTMTDINKVVMEHEKVQGELDERRKQLTEVKNKTQAAKLLQDNLRALIAEKNPHDVLVEKQQEAIDKITKEIAALEAAQLAAEIEMDIAGAVESVYAPAGVRALILDEITPELNAQTAKYLSTLSDGNIDATWTTLVRDAKGNLKEKFAIEVSNAKGAKKFGGLSGGEKRKVRIATALALQDLVATRAIKPIELFIGDEIDDALDKSGLERLLAILEEKAKDRGTVMVISHNDLSDWISSTIQIEKMPGGNTSVTEYAA